MGYANQRGTELKSGCFRMNTILLIAFSLSMIPLLYLVIHGAEG